FVEPRRFGPAGINLRSARNEGSRTESLIAVDGAYPPPRRESCRGPGQMGVEMRCEKGVGALVIYLAARRCNEDHFAALIGEQFAFFLCEVIQVNTIAPYSASSPRTAPVPVVKDEFVSGRAEFVLMKVQTLTFPRHTRQP